MSDIVAERIVLTTTLDPYRSLRSLSKYAEIGVSTLRAYIATRPGLRVPCSAPSVAASWRPGYGGRQ